MRRCGGHPAGRMGKRVAMPIDLLIAAILLFAAAVVFLVAELFVPAHGLLAILCGFLTLGGIITCFYIGPVFGTVSILAVMVFGPLLLFTGVRYYPKSPVGRRILMSQPNPDSIKGFSDHRKELADMVGRAGVAVTTLRPAGVCAFEERRLASVSEGMIITSGTRVVVIGVSGAQVVVRAAKEAGG